jgi:hypothetical protein
MDPSTLQPVTYPSFNDYDNIVEGIANVGPTILQLTKSNSPFMKQLILMPEDSYRIDLNGATTEYFQYFLYIKDANAAHPLE